MIIETDTIDTILHELKRNYEEKIKKTNENPENRYFYG